MNEKHSIGFSSLSQLLPDGVVQIKKYSIDESKKINHRIDRTKESKILAGNQFLLLCIKGKCRKSINLLSTKPMKALNYNSKHIPNVHPEEARQPLEEEILIHSYISVQGKGNKKKYVDHFQLLKVINKSTYQYIRKGKRTLFSTNYNQKISYYDPIDLRKQKSSIPPKKKAITLNTQSKSKTSSPPTSSPPTSLPPAKAISPLPADKKESCSGCSYLCSGNMCGCTVCKGWICYTHFNDKYKLLFEKYNIPPLTYERMEVIGNKIAFVCHDCINKVKEPIEEQQLYIQEYFRLQYGIDGRNSLKKIRASEGHKWLVVNADYLIYYFIEELKYDVNKFQLLIKDSDWMKKGYDDDEKENGMLKYERRNNIKHSQTLDRKENLDDDRLGVITIEDLID